MLYAVVDVETTGGDPQRSGITEIAIVLTDGTSMLKEYQTLVHPAYSIPHDIRLLTGITPEMVADAPTFETIAEEVHSFLGDAVFVAQNVYFDLGFVQKALADAGISYKPRHKLCTARYARAVIPGKRSYSLRNLCALCGVSNERPHRALSDARATAEVLIHLLSRDTYGVIDQQLKKRSLSEAFPPKIDRQTLDELPREPGIYLFRDHRDRVVYVGKAKNLFQRVRSHFSGKYDTRLAHQLRDEAVRLDHRKSGSELMASLMEDHEIRHRWPRFNRAQKENSIRYGIFAYRDWGGHWRLGIHRSKRYQQPLQSFYSLYAARNWLIQQVESRGFLPEMCAVNPWSEYVPVTVEEHDQRLEQWMQEVQDVHRSFVVELPGRQEGEKGIIWVREGAYKGFGFVSEEKEVSFRLLEKGIDWKKDSPTARGLIEQYISRYPDAAKPIV